MMIEMERSGPDGKQVAVRIIGTLPDGTTGILAERVFDSDPPGIILTEPVVYIRLGHLSLIKE